MGNFEESIDDHIKEAKRKLALAESNLSEMIHDCNCDYCDRQGEREEDVEPEYVEGAEEAISDCKFLITRLERHKELHLREVKNASE